MKKTSDNTVRSAARALIVRDGRLLAIAMRDRDGLFYILPGGGQNHGETLADTLIRECREEIGAEIHVGPLLYVREYIGKNHAFAARHKGFHQIEMVFRCQLTQENQTLPARGGSGKDKRQVGVEWLDLSSFDNVRFYPEILKRFVKGSNIEVSTLYLGAIN